MKDLSKRYYLFSMSEYYPQGGLNDVVDTFEDGDEAIKACKGIMGGIIFDYWAE